MAEEPLAEESIFLDALQIESESERLKFLDCACGADTDLRSAVERLLRATKFRAICWT